MGYLARRAVRWRRSAANCLAAALTRCAASTGSGSAALAETFAVARLVVCAVESVVAIVVFAFRKTLKFGSIGFELMVPIDELTFVIRQGIPGFVEFVDNVSW